MRGYYAILNDTPYELAKLSLTQASQIVGEEQDTVTCAPVVQDKSLTISIHKGSELSKRTQTNKELADSFKQFLKDNQITDITKLSDHFVIYIEYALRDNMSGAVVDHGAAIKDVSPKSLIFPLGITSEDEYVARLGMELAASAEMRYSSRHPYGINDPYRRESYTFTVQRIWITAIKEEAWSVKPIPKRRRPHFGQHKYDYEAPQVITGTEADRAWGLPYGMAVNDCDPAIGIRPLHPSVGAVSYLPKDASVAPSEVVIVYDSAALYEDSVYTTTINFAPSVFHIDFKIKSLLPILLSSDEVDEILTANKEKLNSTDDNIVSSTPSDNDSSTIIAGDDNDVTPPTTDGEDNENNTESPSESDNTSTELTGDDKDVNQSETSEETEPSTEDTSSESVTNGADEQGATE